MAIQIVDTSLAGPAQTPLKHKGELRAAPVQLLTKSGRKRSRNTQNGVTQLPGKLGPIMVPLPRSAVQSI